MEKEKEKGSSATGVIRRVSIDLSEAQHNRLSRLEALSGASSKSEVIREALRLYEFLINKSQSGYEFSMKREGESAERLHMFYTE